MSGFHFNQLLSYPKQVDEEILEWILMSERRCAPLLLPATFLFTIQICCSQEKIVDRGTLYLSDRTPTGVWASCNMTEVLN